MLQGALRVGVLSALTLLLFLSSGSPSSATVVFTVTNNADSGAGSLRQAILDSNASSDANVIDFSIAGGGVHTITPTSAELPALSAPVDIDATSQPGYAGTPLIELDGGSISACDCVGLLVLAPATIRG